MPKIKGFGLKDVDDLVDAKNEFSNEVVPKGIYKAKVKRMTHGIIRKEGENKGKVRFGILLEVVETPKLPKKYVKAGVWTGINVIPSGAGFCNEFINALAGPDAARQKALRRAFWNEDVYIDGEGNVTKIGKKRIGSPNGEIVVTIKTKMGKDNQGNPRAEVQSFLIPKGDDDEEDDDLETEEVEEDDDIIDEDEDEDEDLDDDEDDSEDEDSDEDDDEDESDAEDEDDEDESEEEDEEEEESLEEQLDALTLVALRKRAKGHGIKTTGLDKEDLIEQIVAAETGSADEDSDEDDEDDEDDPF